MKDKLFNFLNLHPDNNQKWTLSFMFIKGLLITYANPAITKAVITALPAEWIAFEALFGSIAGLVVGMLWKGSVRKEVSNHFAAFAIIESLAGFMLAMYLCFVSFNVWVFAICSLIYTSFISIFVGKCVMLFKSKLWTEQGREVYDNNLSIVSGVVCILGFGLALLFMPSINAALFLWGMCCILDDIGWIIVYKKNEARLHI